MRIPKHLQRFLQWPGSDGELLLLLSGFNPRNQTSQTVQRRVPFRIQHLLQTFHGVGDVADGFGQDSACGVGVAAFELLSTGGSSQLWQLVTEGAACND